MALGRVVWIGVVIEWIEKATILRGVNGVEEVYDAIYPDVEGPVTMVGGEVLGGKWCGRECYARGGWDVEGVGLLLGEATGYGAEGGVDMGSADGVSTAEGGWCVEDGGGGTERAVEDGQEVGGGGEHG